MHLIWESLFMLFYFCLFKSHWCNVNSTDISHMHIILKNKMVKGWKFDHSILVHFCPKFWFDFVNDARRFLYKSQVVELAIIENS